MAKQKAENGIESAQTHEWLTMSEAADRVGKSQATIRTALRNHPVFAGSADESGIGYMEIKPTLRFPDGTERPGSGRGNIVVRADKLTEWAASTPERVPGRRVAGTIYKINVQDTPLLMEHMANLDHAIADARVGIDAGWTIRDAIAVLLTPFDVNMRKANVRKPKDESSADDQRHAGDFYDGSESQAQDQAAFELELIEG